MTYYICSAFTDLGSTAAGIVHCLDDKYYLDYLHSDLSSLLMYVYRPPPISSVLKTPL